MNYFIGVFFFFSIGTAVSEWTTTDGRADAIRCFQHIMFYADITNLLIDVTTPETIDAFCRRHAELQKCTRDNEHYMTVKESTEYHKNISGVNNFFAQVCPPGSDITEDYKKNAGCFKLIRNKILSCGSDLPDIQSYRMINDIPFRCCNLEKHRVCLKTTTQDTCGYEAAEVVEKVLFRYYDRPAKVCSSRSLTCDISGPSTTQDWETTANEWGKWQETNVWRKKHKSAASVILNSMTSVISCLATGLLFKFKACMF